MKRMQLVAVGMALLLAITGCSSEQVNAGISNATEAAAAATSAAGGAIDTVSDPQFREKQAYSFKATGARKAFYEAGSGGWVGGTATKIALEKCFSGTALTQIEAQVAEWPENVSVEQADITIDTAIPNDTDTQIVLTTHESWKVIDESGNILIGETNQPHTVTLQRDMAGFMDSWIVTTIT